MNGEWELLEGGEEIEEESYLNEVVVFPTFLVKEERVSVDATSLSDSRMNSFLKILGKAPDLSVSR
eukprot:CAMPEP_0194190988 /NCGR_PEP_ID=MMETSP0154-20130528/65106_1 /TAXON_ID=1049557 /ORGANISM="Thalassiothrix antarctica, Strain L6-D1" /LENGTH=65 /DNA_ID=CAMNT_0038913307 /DNA_START=594 /DNA_END=787 /DNA_ORIENTATION=-